MHGHKQERVYTPCTQTCKYKRTHTLVHTLQGLREGELERVGCYLFISLSCSQEATSPQSCKHTETQASVSLNPGNNKRSLYTSMHTLTWDACTSTATNLGCQNPSRAMTRQQHPFLPWDCVCVCGWGGEKAERKSGQALNSLKGICYDTGGSHKTRDDFFSGA